MTRFVIKIEVTDSLSARATLSRLLVTEDVLTLVRENDGIISVVHEQTGTRLGIVPTTHPVNRVEDFTVIGYEVVGNSHLPLRSYLSITAEADIKTRSRRTQDEHQV